MQVGLISPRGNRAPVEAGSDAMQSEQEGPQMPSTLVSRPNTPLIGLLTGGFVVMMQ